MDMLTAIGLFPWLSAGGQACLIQAGKSFGCRTDFRPNALQPTVVDLWKISGTSDYLKCVFLLCRHRISHVTLLLEFIPLVPPRSFPNCKQHDYSTGRVE